jgi:glycosyltransferase involved in cell wall biosynthesis
MNILQISHRLPWPPIDGGKKGTLGFVENYRQHPDVDSYRLVCMCPEDEVPWAQEWRAESAVNVEVDAMDARNTVARILVGTLFSRQAFNMRKYQRATFSRKVEAALKASPPDIVHFDSLHTACYADVVRRLAPKALRVLRCHNAEYIILERLSESEGNPLKRAALRIHARRLKQYEAQSLANFDLILAITESDASRFLSLNTEVSSRLMVLPAGVDLPADLPAAPLIDGVVRLVHIAAMDWQPNQSGLRWLLEQVLPVLDRSGLNYHLDIVGKNMPASFLSVRHPRVTVHGFVRNLDPITSQAHLAVVPLQVGGGMRVKILDYWALGIPVITTRVGAEGLLEPGEHVLALADDAADFAGAIGRMAASRDEREAIRRAAFEKLEANFEWQSLIDKLISRYKALGANQVR